MRQLSRTYPDKYKRVADLVRLYITQNDVNRSATVGMLSDIVPYLKYLEGSPMEKMLDVGCGWGGLTKVISDYLEIDEVHGIDVDETVFKEAEIKGVITHKIDVEKECLPFRDERFDLVTSFGVFEHLVYFDHVVNEIFRVLKCGGYFLVSVPNLASWSNRLLLLMGYQPRDIEVSQTIVVGAHKHYSHKPIGHIHAITLRALRDLMEFYGFKTIKVSGGKPYIKRLKI